ncbi:MAG: filamentous hemagglutinin N-terminal domain-containing protein [Cyanobacteria bacterium J06638_20]
MTSSVAQLIPDTTLGSESSVVVPGTLSQVGGIDLVEGGALRGPNLFHSFAEFNIDTEQWLYFVNPVGIENILSRVTGASPSHINGLLGVTGNANLFLLNPNGVIFGPDARLDISGSFTASTAQQLTFADGSSFSATPATQDLLTVSVPLGVQFNHLPQSDISNTGILATGENLTLFGQNLDVQGQLLAGNDLTLQAANTVTVRDTPSHPFLARAGNDLTIQGNQSVDIWALQHLEQTPLISGGDLTLISDGVISADAHFESGGDFSIQNLAGETTNFVSFYDPIFNVGGNYTVGNYTGASLQVNAGGNITFGNVVIDAIDPLVHPTNPAFLLNSGGRITGNGDISTTVGSGGLIIDFRSQGNLNLTGNIDTDGGNIALSSNGNITFVGNTNTRPVASAGAGGDVSIRGGSVTLNGDIDPANLGDAVLNTGGKTGNTTITSTSGDITLNAGTIFGDAGFNIPTPPSNPGGTTIVPLGGNITLNSARDITLTDYELNSTYYYRGVGANPIAAGTGGSITLTAARHILIQNDSLITSDAEAGGTPGDISLTSTNGDITIRNDVAGIGEISNQSRGGDPNLTEQGSVNITAQNGSILLDQATINTSTDDTLGPANDPALAGDIVLAASENVTIQNASTVSSEGNAGFISIGNGNTNAVTIINSIVSATNSAIDGNAPSGDIVLTAQGEINLLDETDFDATTTGVGNGGSIKLRNAEIIALDNTDLDATTSGAGNGGNITFQNAGAIALNNTDLDAVASDAGNGGNITFQNAATATFNNTQLDATTEGTGLGGGIILQNIRTVTLNTTTFEAETSNMAADAGAGGDIRVQGVEALILNRSSLEAETTGAGEAGSILVSNTDALAMRNGSLLLSDATQNNTNGGDIVLNVKFLVSGLAENNDIIANSEGGMGGTIAIEALSILGFTPQAIFQSTDQLRANTVNDISARSGVGADGEVDIDNLDIDPSSGITELPTDLTDRTSQIVSGCGLGNTNAQGELVVTGAGGLPPTPNTPATTSQSHVPWVTENEATASTATPVSVPAVEEPLVEAQGIVLDDHGTPYLVADTTVAIAPSTAELPRTLCAANRQP